MRLLAAMFGVAGQQIGPLFLRFIEDLQHVLALPDKLLAPDCSSWSCGSESQKASRSRTVSCAAVQSAP